MTDPRDLPALRQLGRTVVRLRSLVAEYSHEKLPADLVRGLLDEVRKIDAVLDEAAKGVERG